MTERRTRLQAAAETRRRVLDHARELFLRQGYAATSTRQVAAESGVTERTLFNIVPSKGELLRQVMLAHVFEEDHVPLLQRADFAVVLEATSPQEFLSGFSQWVTHLHQSTAAFAEVIRAAASVDAGATALWRWGNERQVSDCEELVTWLQGHGWLRAGPASEVAASLAVLCGHENYWRLTTECAWPAATYCTWLMAHCSAELFQGDVEPHGGVVTL